MKTGISEKDMPVLYLKLNFAVVAVIILISRSEKKRWSEARSDFF